MKTGRVEFGSDGSARFVAEKPLDRFGIPVYSLASTVAARDGLETILDCFGVKKGPDTMPPPADETALAARARQRLLTAYRNRKER